MVEDFVKTGSKSGTRKQKFKGHGVEKNEQQESTSKLMSGLFSPKLKCKGLALLSTFLSFCQLIYAPARAVSGLISEPGLGHYRNQEATEPWKRTGGL